MFEVMLENSKKELSNCDILSKRKRMLTGESFIFFHKAKLIFKHIFVITLMCHLNIPKWVHDS